jgi:gluconate 2-dehydrogenase gamma chain
MGSFTRRRYLEYLSGGLGAAVLRPDVLAAMQHAHESAQAAPAAKFTYFDAATAAEVEALAARIIPSDETPGAREAGVVFFIDRALATFDSNLRKDYRDGLDAMQKKRRELYPASASIAALAPEQADAVLRAMEKTEFFDLLRLHTLMGFLGNPSYGGNRGEVGWKSIGFQDAHIFRPPFGWYDDPKNMEASK